MSNEKKLIEIFNTILDVFGDNGIMIISYIYATQYRNILRTEGMNLPFLFLTGDRTTGKTEMAKTIQSAFSKKNEYVFYDLSSLKRCMNMGDKVDILDETVRLNITKRDIEDFSDYYNIQYANIYAPNLIICSQNERLLDRLSKYIIKVRIENSIFNEERHRLFQYLVRERHVISDIFTANDREFEIHEKKFKQKLNGAFYIYRDLFKIYDMNTAYHYANMLCIFESIPYDIKNGLILNINPIKYFRKLYVQDYK